MTKIYRAIGLMSGTSCDGIDVAIIETDGEDYVKTDAALTLPYPHQLRARLLAVMGKTEAPYLPDLTRELTERHAEAVELLLRQAGLAPSDIDLIGFHGQTIHHAPQDGVTVQLGDGQQLANTTGINVINDFRKGDVAAGGQGAPLVPLYHAALATALPKPCAIVNIGGVANITYLGANSEIIAFDTGPGCALIDDATQAHFGFDQDMNGEIAALGIVNSALLNDWLAHEFFTQAVPKSLDRHTFTALTQSAVEEADATDLMATLTAFTAQSIAKAQEHLPAAPLAWYITGGGRHNLTLMKMLQAAVNAPVSSVDTLGWHGDALEAQAFAYLAVRSVKGLPLSLPTTTGVKQPMTGGTFYAAAKS